MMKKFLSMLACVLLVASTSIQASTYTNYPASVGTGGGLPAIYSGRTYVLESSWDTRGSGYMQNGPLTTGQTIKMIYIPADTVVLGVGLHLDNPAAAASASQLTVGDSAGAAYWLAAAYVTNGATASLWSTPVLTKTSTDTNSAAITTTPYNGLGKLYTSADYILVTVTGAPTNVAFTVKALAIPLNK